MLTPVAMHKLRLIVNKCTPEVQRQIDTNAYTEPPQIKTAGEAN